MSKDRPYGHLPNPKRSEAERIIEKIPPAKKGVAVFNPAGSEWWDIVLNATNPIPDVPEEDEDDDAL